MTNIDKKRWSLFGGALLNTFKLFFLHNVNYFQGLLNIILFHKKNNQKIADIIKKGDFLQKGILKSTLHESFSLQNTKKYRFWDMKKPQKARKVIICHTKKNLEWFSTKTIDPICLYPKKNFKECFLVFQATRWGMPRW